MGFQFNVGRSTFDLPEADKCLLAFGEFDVLCFSPTLQISVHFSTFRPFTRRSCGGVATSRSAFRYALCPMRSTSSLLLL